MRLEIAQRLVSELRSGKYKQIRHRFRDDNNGRCINGILFDMFQPDTGVDMSKVYTAYNLHHRPDLNIYMWRDLYAAWLGNNDLDIMTRGFPLAILNNAGMSFAIQEEYVLPQLQQTCAGGNGQVEHEKSARKEVISNVC